MTAAENHCPQCGAAMARPAEEDALCPVCTMRTAMAQVGEDVTPSRRGLPEMDTVAEQFPEFEIQTLVGRGGMGAVYRARHRRMDRLVALKVLLPDLEHDPEFAERFEREARALGRLQHPGVVGVHDFGDREGAFYLVMEFVDGANLRELMGAGTLVPRDALALVPQICDALQYAHDQGVVHRDIKPENILVDQEGRVRIADFGLVKLLADGDEALTMTGHGQRLGTPHYMAPEQLGGGAVDHRADIFSLGVVLYELLTGGLPVGRFDVPSKKSPDARKLDSVVMRSLENEPEERFQNAREMKAGMEDGAISGLGEAAVRGWGDADDDGGLRDDVPTLWGLPGHRDIWVHGAVAVLVTFTMFVPVGSRIRVDYWRVDIMGVPIPLMVLSHLAAVALAAMRVRYCEIHRWLGIGVLLPSALIGAYLGFAFMVNLLEGRERPLLSIALLAMCGAGALIYEGWARWPLWMERPRWVGPPVAPRLRRGQARKKDWEIRRHELRRSKRQQQKVLTRVRAASAPQSPGDVQQSSTEPEVHRLPGQIRRRDEQVRAGRELAMRAWVITLSALVVISGGLLPHPGLSSGQIWQASLLVFPMWMIPFGVSVAAVAAWCRASGWRIPEEFSLVPLIVAGLLSVALFSFTFNVSGGGWDVSRSVVPGVVLLGTVPALLLESVAAFRRRGPES